MKDKEKLKKIKELADAMYYAAQYLTTDTSRLHEAMDEYHQFIINEYHKEEPVSEDNNLRKASEEYLKVLSETPYNNTPITNAQTIVRELITFLDIPSKYNPNHIEEPVSEDLEEAIKKWLTPQLDKSYANYGEVKMMELTHFDGYAMLDAIEFGVNWQKEQFEKNRLKHCNSITNEQAELEQGFIDQHLDKYQRMPTFLDAIEYGMRLQKEQMMASRAEKFIQDYTRNCSNELIAVESRAGKEVISYHEWLTPDQARAAVEIAREEIYEWLINHNDYIIANGSITRFDMKKCVDDLKQAMKDETENL